MYQRDPIMSSSPAHTPPPRNIADSGDEVDFITQATLPLDGTRSAHFAMPTITQPTQILTPSAHRFGSPSQVQVARSSPSYIRHSSPAMSQSQPSQRPWVNPMAPPGTRMFAPRAVPRPIPIDLTSDDPPVEIDSEEEDTGRSNIKPSVFERTLASIEGSPQKFIAETPPKPARTFSVNQFAYNHNIHPIHAPNNLKRPADGPPGNLHVDKRARPSAVQQSGPARAKPVDMSLETIPDYDSRNKVSRIRVIVPSKTVEEIYHALMKARGNYHDALEMLTESSEDELCTPPFVAKLKAAEPKKTAKRELNAPARTIQDKFSTIRQSVSQTVDVTETPPKKKGRLQRGRRNPSPTSSPAHPQKHKKVVSEDEDEAILIGSDSDSDAQQSEEDVYDTGDLLKFFNTCSVAAMVDLSNKKEEDVRAVLDQRPFRSLAQIEKIHVDSSKKDASKKAKKPKITFGERLVDSATGMWRGYTAIDHVVKKCKDLGKPIAATMATWGVDVFGADKSGEVAITSLGGDDSPQDSGIGTPSSLSSEVDADDVRKQLTTIRSNKSTFLKKPANMNDDIQLKDYQVVGLNWLNTLWENGISGILADDMGLGKTCQVISFISHLCQKKVPGPHLIVVPGSTLENWLREFKHFSKKIKAQPYYGLQAARLEQQQQILDNIDDIDVIVTTYDLTFKDSDNKFLRKCKPQVCIFDEGHMLRNKNSDRYKKLMKVPATCRYLLTGTPLQNNLKELMSILAFLMPEIFRDVEEDISVVFNSKGKVNDSKSHETLLSDQRIQRARSMMTPFVLRRKKDQVLKHLPTKTSRVEYCELTETQSRIYKARLDAQCQVLLDREAGKTPKGQTNVMMKLRQAAIHPLLSRDRYDDKVIKKMSKTAIKETALALSDPDTIFEELKIYQDYQCHQLALKYPKHLGKFGLQNEEWMDSGKVAKLVELLKKHKANGDRTLVFSQFTSVMDILEWVLDTVDISYFRLDGQTPIAERQDMLDEFYADESIPVFMLSTKSGGAGINLACANKVIIFDSSFNPQDDVQAENRAHRVGQKREVEVIRLVTKGTVEEQIHALGVSKLELDKMVSGEEAAADAKKGKKKEEDEEVTGEEKVGMKAVEDMLLEQIKKAKEKEKEKESKEESGDGAVGLKDKFLDGLKKAGLDMSAA
ncbi:hypothetical protein P154DRAFT_523296 [Amniculicola lignicola CBS 123094]|uniref:DNA helicase n=1 Tax=Amniculicola lignicola CBS 123094 TaxID=1392246 RepID=A0A6A5WCW5_9PLEO|nr:hypothetical protein P154DRAFT_523296 [Amniculicola lignicola CBS 123094]